MFASPRSALGLRRSLVRSKNPGKESPGTGTRPGQTDRHYKCHPSQHKHQDLSTQSHMSMFQFTALTHRVSSTAPITARRTRPSSPWRPCWSTPATPDTSRSASPTPSVSSTTPRRSGLGPTSPASVSPWRQQSLTQWWDPLNISAITCGEPEDIPAGILERKCQTFGCRISYTCEPGYQLAGRTHRYCQADGSWSPQLLPECKRELKLVIMTSNAPETVLVSGLCVPAICYSVPDLSPINMLLCSSGLLSHSLAPGLRSRDVQLGDLQLPDLLRVQLRLHDHRGERAALWPEPGVDGAPAHLQRWELRLTVVTFVEQFHRILSNWNSQVESCYNWWQWACQRDMMRPII